MMRKYESEPSKYQTEFLYEHQKCNVKNYSYAKYKEFDM